MYIFVMTILLNVFTLCPSNSINKEQVFILMSIGDLISMSLRYLRRTSVSHIAWYFATGGLKLYVPRLNILNSLSPSMFVTFEMAVVSPHIVEYFSPLSNSSVRNSNTVPIDACNVSTFLSLQNLSNLLMLASYFECVLFLHAADSISDVLLESSAVLLSCLNNRLLSASFWGVVGAACLSPVVWDSCCWWLLVGEWPAAVVTVSYTHLTLPTILLV